MIHSFIVRIRRLLDLVPQVHEIVIRHFKNSEVVSRLGRLAASKENLYGAASRPTSPVCFRFSF